MNTADLIWLNGEFVAWEDAKVHVLTHALHYGTGVFEGIRAYETPEGTGIFRHQVLAPYRESRHSEEDDARFEATLARLRQLTLDAIVSGFRRASNQVISRSFARD